MYPPLGKKICIINVDTRGWDYKMDLAAKDTNQWGLMNHYMYCKTIRCEDGYMLEQR